MSNAPLESYDGEFLWVRGHRVHVRVQGHGDPLLLLNGLTRPLESWDPFVHALGERTIVSFDAPGVGQSPLPLLPLSIAQLAELALSVLDEVGRDRVDVLGFSHGGAVAQQFAYQYPARVRRLVLVATSCGAGATLSGWNSLDGLGVASKFNRSQAKSALWRTMAISAWSSIPFLGAITAPTLVVCGIDDRVAPIANSRALAGRIPNASLIVLPDGHDLQRPEPAAALAHAVDTFLGVAVVAPLARNATPVQPIDIASAHPQRRWR
ncbi:MAG TPA: alpha/beta fold hydrolase [Acidimicrobiales bacterium]|nr:alpha/beta fold hydrolase [Acidimicrobiales bacterium]